MVDVAIVKRSIALIVMNMSAANFYCRTCNNAVVMNMTIIEGRFTVHVMHMTGYIGITAGYSGIFVCMLMIYACYTVKVM